MHLTKRRTLILPLPVSLFFIFGIHIPTFCFSPYLKIWENTASKTSFLKYRFVAESETCNKRCNLIETTTSEPYTYGSHTIHTHCFLSNSVNQPLAWRRTRICTNVSYLIFVASIFCLKVYLSVCICLSSGTH